MFVQIIKYATLNDLQKHVSLEHVLEYFYILAHIMPYVKQNFVSEATQ